MGKLKTISAVIAIILLNFSCSSDSGQAMSSEELNKTEDKQDSIQVYGEIKAKNEFQVSLSFPITVLKIFVDNGELAKKGDAVLQFDNSQFLIDISSKEYELAVAKLEFEKIKKDFEKSGKTINNEYLNLQNNIDTSNKELKQVEKELKQNRDFYEEKNSPELLKLFNNQSSTRSEYLQQEEKLKEKANLLAKEVISQQEYDEAKQSLTKKEDALKALELSIESALFQLESQISQEEIKVRNLKAAIENMERQLANFQGPETSALDIQRLKINLLEKQLNQLKSKMAFPYIHGNLLAAQYDQSIISNHQASDGSNLGAGQQLYNEIDANSLIIIANIPEDFIPDIFLGIDAEITPLADRNKSFKGKVTKISGMAQVIQGESVIPIEIDFENTEGFLKLGYNVDVKIYLQPENQKLQETENEKKE